MLPRLSLLLAPALLAACGTPDAVEPTPEPSATAAPVSEAALPSAAAPMPTPSPSHSPAVGATPSPSPSPAATAAPGAGTGGAPIDLGALAPDDDAALTGELRCSFAVDGRTLLIGAGDVDPKARALAVVRNGGMVERLVSRGEGGYDRMVDGTSFGGRGLIATLAPGEKLVTGTEEVRQRATLTLQRADGAERVYEGDWSCGP